MYQANPTNLDVELLPPVSKFGPGDHIELDLELITLPRQATSGDVGDSDVYGAQQHAPLFSLTLED